MNNLKKARFGKILQIELFEQKSEPSQKRAEPRLGGNTNKHLQKYVKEKTFLGWTFFVK